MNMTARQAVTFSTVCHPMTGMRTKAQGYARHYAWPFGYACDMLMAGKNIFKTLLFYHLDI